MATTPNILLIVTDQQRADTLACYARSTLCRTPHLNALAEESVVFQNAYTVCAVCSPARASLQTGLYPHAHGVETNIYQRGCLVHELPDSDLLLSRRLQRAGYSIGYTGKWHIGEGGANLLKEKGGLQALIAPSYSGLPKDLGYEGDNFAGHGGGGYCYPEFKDYLASKGMSFEVARRDNYGGGHTTTGEVVSPIESTNEYFLVEQAIFHLDRFRARKQPFCFQLHFWGPHEPFFAPTEFLDHYKNICIPPWPNFDENRSNRPEFHEIFRRPDKSWSFWENSLRHYYAFMESIDAQIGRLIAYLKENDLYDNTAILFTSDHGDSQGCHGGIENKSYHLYEEIVRIPLVVKAPRSHASASGSVDSYANTCDLYATILAMAGLPVPEAESAHGRSLLPFLSGESPETWRDCVVTEGLSASSALCSHRMIRQGDWKYMFYASGTDELYNLKSDPWETTNRIADPHCREVIVELQGALNRWMNDCQDDLRCDYQQLRRIGQRA